MDEHASLELDGRRYTLPVVVGTEGELAVDITGLRRDSGMIHGSAPRMVTEGRGELADPSSLMRAAAMLLHHIGCTEAADRLDAALDLATARRRQLAATGWTSRPLAAEFTDGVLASLARRAPVRAERVASPGTAAPGEEP